MPSTDLSDLPPFRPPYRLAGSCFVAVGLWKSEHAPPAGFTSLSLFGEPLAVLIANHYTKPPPELPIEYHEVICASLVRRGLTVAAAPFDMVLDAAIPVTLGREHYGLPKRLDASLYLEDAAAGVAATASGLELQADRTSALFGVLAAPIRLGFGLAVRAITSSIDVVGDAYPPAQRARIALTPRGLGRALRMRRCLSQGRGLRTVWCQAWDFTSTSLGAPHLLSGES